MADLLSQVLADVLARVAGDAGVQTLLGNPARVYDCTPDKPAYPYMVMGQSEGRDVSCKSLPVQTVLLTFDIFSRQRHGQEARTVLNALRACLHDAQLNNVARVQEEQTSLRAESNGTLLHAIARYRLVVG